MEAAIAASLQLADRTSRAVAALWNAHTAGRLSVEQFRQRAARVIANANGHAVSLADLAVTAQLARFLHDTVPPLGLTPTEVQVDAARIDAALARILTADITAAETPDTQAASRLARVTRLGKDEPLLTMAIATHTAMTERGVERWVRVTDADPCPLCVRWADGKARRVSTAMNRHKGCACVPQPVFRRSHPNPVQALDQLEATIAARVARR